MDLLYIKKCGDNRRKSNNHQINNASNRKGLSYVSRTDEVNISNKNHPCTRGGFVVNSFGLLYYRDKTLTGALH